MLMIAGERYKQAEMAVIRRFPGLAHSNDGFAIYFTFGLVYIITEREKSTERELRKALVQVLSLMSRRK